MKKTIAVFGIILLISANTLMVHAGSMNENELAIVGVAQSQFEIDGVKYHIDSSYINELINYLNLDDVDLSAAQKDEAISTIYANTKQGITDGYLVPTESQTKPENTVEDGAIEDGTSQPDTDKPDADKPDANQPDETDTTEIVTSDNQTDFVAEVMKPVVTTTEIDKANSKIIVTDKNSNNILTVNTVIKNTGFNLNRTVIMAVGMVIIMGICVIVTVKQGFFAQSDE